MRRRRKQLKVLAITLLLSVIALTGCEVSRNTQEDYTEITSDNRFSKIPNEENLYYDTNTYIVYYIASYYEAYTYMTAYYGSNGNPYTYNVVSGRLEETP